MDLRDAAQELYSVVPRDFTGRRTELARKAKDSGDSELAKQLARLTKPAAGAWAINALASHKPEVIDGVVRFGAALRQAQEEGNAEAFRELGQQRQGELAAAVSAAKDLAGQLGAALSAAAAGDVEQTLRAAMADAGAASAIGSGRLVRGLSGSGFEAVDLTDAIAAGGPEDEAPTHKAPAIHSRTATKPAQPSPAKAKDAQPEEAATSLAERRAAKRQAALTEAKAEFEAADKEARDAEEAASQAWEAVKSLERRRKTLQKDIEDARQRLASLEAELIGATRDTETAESAKKAAVRAATQLRRTADQAKRRVERLD